VEKEGHVVFSQAALDEGKLRRSTGRGERGETYKRPQKT